MGSVAMGSGGNWVFEGYNITDTAYCLYCDKCGTPFTTSGNVMNYPEFDRSVLDVPYEKTIRYYVDE